MTTACKTITRRFTFEGHEATVCVPIVCGQPMAVQIEWNASRPPRLSRRAFAKYQQLRNAVLQTIAAELGGSIAVVDLGPAGVETVTEIKL